MGSFRKPFTRPKRKVVAIKVDRTAPVGSSVEPNASRVVRRQGPTVHVNHSALLLDVMCPCMAAIWRDSLSVRRHGGNVCGHVAAVHVDSELCSSPRDQRHQVGIEIHALRLSHTPNLCVQTRRDPDVEELGRSSASHWRRKLLVLRRVVNALAPIRRSKQASGALCPPLGLLGISLPCRPAAR
jgi:hypothetical protein